MVSQENKILPSLREDLTLIPTSASEDGSKRWLIYDSLSNKYFHLSEDTFTLISYWENGLNYEMFLKKLEKNNYFIEEIDLEVFIEFLLKNSLTIIKSNEDIKKLAQQEKQRKQNFFKWLFKNYLFIRIPLFKPDNFLDKTQHIANIFYSKYWYYSILLMGFIGIIMTLRNWDSFWSTFLYFFSLEGLFYYLISLIFVKSLHELGHAYTAKKYGCRVSSMGVAFLVLFPVLYTDTTDAWKLYSKYERLKIVVAGVKVELYLALIATFLWSFLPDGPLKSIVFIIATTSWISSVIINISPFLRFDGYYALSDMTDSKNLQPRSFALAKWYIRKNILGINEKEPEKLPSSKKRFFIIYAFLTWIYRFFLFLGIAILVYYLTFKVLGIILFIVEIIWFILLPIYKELQVWWSKKEQIKWNKNTIASSLILCILILIFFLPWNSTIKMPAVLESQLYTNLYSPKPAKIKQILVQTDDIVKKGQVLFILQSDDISFELEQVLKQIKLAELKLKRAGSTISLISEKFVLEEELLLLYRKKNGLEQIKNSLVIKAPFSGKIYFSGIIEEGIFLNSKIPFASIYNKDNIKISAYALQNEAQNIIKNDEVYFIDNSGTYPKLEAKIDKVSSYSESFLEYPELSSNYGGNIATRMAENNSLKTEKVYNKVIASLNEKDFVHNQRTVGVLVVKVKATSFSESLFNTFMSLLIKESGF